MGQDQKNTTWLVTVNDGTAGDSTYQVTAAYTRTDQSNYPGYVLLHDEDRNLVALVPYQPNLLIRRADSDPTLHRAAKASASASASAPQITFTGTQSSGAPSPAQLAALAQHAAKAARV